MPLRISVLVVRQRQAANKTRHGPRHFAKAANFTARIWPSSHLLASMSDAQVDLRTLGVVGLPTTRFSPRRRKGRSCNDPPNLAKVAARSWSSWHFRLSQSPRSLPHSSLLTSAAFRRSWPTWPRCPREAGHLCIPASRPHSLYCELCLRLHGAIWAHSQRGKLDLKVLPCWLGRERA
jgi:hypothetical protein